MKKGGYQPHLDGPHTVPRNCVFSKSIAKDEARATCRKKMLVTRSSGIMAVKYGQSLYGGQHILPAYQVKSKSFQDFWSPSMKAVQHEVRVIISWLECPVYFMPLIQKVGRGVCLMRRQMTCSTRY
ncbi:PREDICTED: uncharacterized protein LOC109187631 [Ipomoea nil]|uniref:uncharacterized protein LOC109187631 n=1 Tax=Ipomoea nil TaxID=35883 RepID=UPI0009014E4F|nr:PREDICTED: uncharacterized protein LOC109187631 [Ipomoea nil]